MALCSREQVYFNFTLHSIFISSPVTEAFDVGFKLEKLCALQKTSALVCSSCLAFCFTLAGLWLGILKPSVKPLGKSHC